MSVKNYSEFETAEANPEASSMIETFRAIGYNIETAVADIIDNSISANAKNIWFDFEWQGSETWLSITDDGDGMDNSELIQAMKPGSKNPVDKRSENDLGRFGLGLKTASFSQARKLTVISRKLDSEMSHWTWDLDYVNQIGEWKLIRYPLDPTQNRRISEMSKGTSIIWSDIDRLVKNVAKDDEKALHKFLESMELVKKHIAMVFHKFIESKQLNIFYQNHPIDSWNPFLFDEKSTQTFPEEKIHNGEVTIEGFVLPHKSKITPEKYKFAEGVKGWNAQQGFYIYRNNRLLLAGDWLGMFRAEEHYKLARIQIELPNNLDSEWQIDIKKSVARPPAVFRDQIRAYAMKVRSQAVEVYRQRGKSVKKIPGQKFVPLWIDHKRDNKWFYKINRDNPIFLQLKEEAKNDSDKAIEKLLRIIEETIPSKSIFIKESEDPEMQGKPFEAVNQDLIRELMQKMYTNLRKQGKTDQAAKSIVLHTDPCSNFEHFLEFLK